MVQVSVDDNVTSRLPASEAAPRSHPQTPSSPAIARDRLFALGVFLVVLIGFLALRWPVLTMPLYEDQSVGFGREADYLAQNDFDYLKLRYEEKHFLFGGTARSYMISAIPTILAALSRVTGSTATTLFLWHFLSFVLAALIAALVFSLLQPRIGRRWALLSAVALLSTPMFLAQADLAGMELPLAACSLWAAMLLVRGRFLGSAVIGFTAFLMKATGAIVSLAILLVLLARRIGSRSPVNRALTVGIIASILLIAVAIAAVVWGDDTAPFRATFAWPSAFRFPRAFLWCPDIAVVCLIGAVAGAVSVARNGVAASIRLVFERMRDGEPSMVLGSLSLLVVSAGIISMFGYIFIPRYYILPLVFLYVLAPLLVFARDSAARVGAASFGVLIVVNLVNVGGALYPPVSKVGGRDLEILALFPPRSCGFSERSLEYLADHRSSINKIRAIAEDHASDSIFLDMPHWIYLTSPFVGYVKEAPPLAFRAENFTDTIREFRERALTLPTDKDLLFLWSGRSRVRVPGPGEGLETLAADNLSPPLALVRAQRDRLPTSPEALEDWYLDHTWGVDFAVHRILDRYEFLRKTGRIRRAYVELQIAKWLFPDLRDRDVERQLAGFTLDLESALRSSVEFEGSTWILSSGAGAAGTISRNDDDGSLLVSVVAAGPVGKTTVRLQGARLRISEGQDVRLRFRMKSTRAAPARVAIERLFEPERPFGFAKFLDVTSEWQEFSFSLPSAGPEPDAVLVFYFGRSDVDFELKDVKFEAVHP